MARTKTMRVLAKADLTVAQRTIGGLLGQLEAVGLNRDGSLELLRACGLPDIAYDEPSFAISVEQDFELLNEIRKYLWPEVSMEVAVFWVAKFTHVHMFGALGLAWQTAPTVLDAIKVAIDHPQINWRRSQMVLAASDYEERMTFALERVPSVFSLPEELAATYKYALLLDVSITVALMMDILEDRSVLVGITLPFEEPKDWPLIAGTLGYPVTFNAPAATVVFKPGFSGLVPKLAHAFSFKLAIRLVEKESALITEDVGLPEQVKRILWSETPPPGKTVVAARLGTAERSLTRRLQKEGFSFSQLVAEVQSERAVNLLANKSLSISQIGYRVGYSDPAAFSRAFTNWKGCSPADWRRQHHE